MGASILRPAALAAVILTAAVFLVFGQSLKNEFVYDDHQMVERNPVIRTLDPATHLGGDFWARRESSFAYFRPVVTWSLALNRATLGTAPWGFHLVNLLVHAATAWLLFLILWRFGQPAVAWLGAAIFAIHPVQTEAVAWIVGRTDLLATLFLLLAALLHLKIPERMAARDLPRLGAVLAALSTALLSKETAVTFPALAFGADLALYRLGGSSWPEAFRRLWSRLVRLGTLYVLVIAAYLVIRFAVVGHLIDPASMEASGELNPLLEASPGVRLLTAVSIMGRYLVLALFPVKLSADYMVDVVPLVSSAASQFFLFPLVAALAAVAGSLLLVRRTPVALFGLVAAGGSYLLVSHLFFPGPIIMAERMLYLSMAGIATLLAAGLLFLVGAFTARRYRPVVTLVISLAILMPLGVRGYFRTLDWKDDRTLFSSTVRVAPRSAQGWLNLGFEQLESRELESAVESFDRALEINPSSFQARLNRLGALRRMGRYGEAAAEVRRLAAEHPQSGEVKLELVRILTGRAERLESNGEVELGRLLREEVAGLSESAAKTGSAATRTVFLQVAANNLFALGRVAEAEIAMLGAVEAAEEEADLGGAVDEAAQGMRTVVLAAAAAFYRKTGRYPEAAEHFERAAEAAEQAGQSDVRLRMLLEAAEAEIAAGRQARALPIYDRLLAADPGNARARHGRARARMAMGDASEAEEDLRMLLDGQPTGRMASAIWTDLAITSTIKRDYREAIDRLGKAIAADPTNAEAARLLEALERQERPSR
jgi:tetratricopeptide (TPR) repeat protein